MLRAVAASIKQGCSKETLINLKSVIASEAKQSTTAIKSTTYGLPRRCAPRNDEVVQSLPNYLDSATTRGMTMLVTANADTATFGRFKPSKLPEQLTFLY